MFEKVTVCHLLPQRAGAADKVVAGKGGNWHGQVSGGHSRLCWRKATALQQAARKQTAEDGAIHGGEKEGCACEWNHGKAPRDRRGGRLEKGQNGMLHEEGYKSGNQHTCEHTGTHTLAASPHPSCQNCHLGAVLAWVVQKGAV